MHARNREGEKAPLGGVHKSLLDQLDASNRDVGGPRLVRSDGYVGDGGWLLPAEVGERPHDIALSWSCSFPSRSIETVVDLLPGGLEAGFHVIRIYDVGPSCIPYVLANCLKELGVPASCDLQDGRHQDHLREAPGIRCRGLPGTDHCTVGAGSARLRIPRSLRQPGSHPASMIVPLSTDT